MDLGGLDCKKTATMDRRSDGDIKQGHRGRWCIKRGQDQAIQSSYFEAIVQDVDRRTDHASQSEWTLHAIEGYQVKYRKKRLCIKLEKCSPSLVVRQHAQSAARPVQTAATVKCVRGDYVRTPSKLCSSLSPV